jgi:hypothetical protein
MRSSDAIRLFKSPIRPSDKPTSVRRVVEAGHRPRYEVAPSTGGAGKKDGPGCDSFRRDDAGVSRIGLSKDLFVRPVFDVMPVALVICHWLVTKVIWSVTARTRRVDLRRLGELMVFSATERAHCYSNRGKWYRPNPSALPFRGSFRILLLQPLQSEASNLAHPISGGRFSINQAK